MPILHKYSGGKRYYVVTSFKGTTVIFKLTEEGIKKVRSAGLEDGESFDKTLLLDLYRSGEAFTSGKVTAEVKGRPLQMKFNFMEDSQPEGTLPSCSVCGFIEDLHLVEVQEGAGTLTVLCRRCRRKKLGLIDTSIPLPLVSRPILERLRSIKKIGKSDSSVAAYQHVLDAEFKGKWDEIARRKKKGKSTHQGNLFEQKQNTNLF